MPSFRKNAGITPLCMPTFDQLSALRLHPWQTIPNYLAEHRAHRRSTRSMYIPRPEAFCEMCLRSPQTHGFGDNSSHGDTIRHKWISSRFRSTTNVRASDANVLAMLLIVSRHGFAALSRLRGILVPTVSMGRRRALRQADDLSTSGCAPLEMQRPESWRRAMRQPIAWKDIQRTQGRTRMHGVGCYRNR